MKAVSSERDENERDESERTADFENGPSFGYLRVDLGMFHILSYFL